MIVSKAKNAESFENSPTCKGISYQNTGNDMDGALITVSGRYPTEGFLINEVCREIVYITSGSGSLLSRGNAHDFSAGDVVFVDKGEVFAWNGSFEGFFVTAPRFDPSQHKEVPA